MAISSYSMDTTAQYAKYENNVKANDHIVAWNRGRCKSSKKAQTGILSREV